MPLPRLSDIFQHNRALNEAYRSVDQLLSQSPNHEAIHSAVQRFSTIRGGTEYDNRLLYLAGGTGILLVTIGILITHLPLLFLPLLIYLGALLALAILRKRRLDLYSQKIFDANLVLDEALEIPKYNSKELIGRYCEYYRIFRRGDQRDLPFYAKGRYQGKTLSFNYSLFHLRYLEEKNEKTGNTQFQRHDRYGIVIRSPFVKYQLSFLNRCESAFKKLQSNYEPASIRFNRHFRTLAANEKGAALFLTPVVVEALTDAADRYLSINYEFIPGALCVSFKENLLFTPTPEASLRDPAAFLTELTKKETTPLHELLAHIERLFIHTNAQVGALNPPSSDSKSDET